MPFSFTLPKSEAVLASVNGEDNKDLEDLAKILKESKIKIKGWEFDDNNRTLQFYLTDLLQAAAIIRALHFQRLDPKADLVSQIMDLYKTYDEFDKEDDEYSSGPGGEGDDRSDFSNFTEDVERGFIDSAGITDPTRPYGREFRERPRIREIGVEQGSIDGADLGG